MATAAGEAVANVEQPRRKGDEDHADEHGENRVGAGL